MQEPIAVQQTVHGYRDGHRLLRSSVQLGTDAARTLLVMSDMSGPTMQPGFEEYVTGYPLPGTDFYVLAKTWYASEMKRPGCVWTQSFLIGGNDVAKFEDPAGLLSSFRRPGVEEADSSGADVVMVPVAAGLAGAAVTGPVAAVVSALYAEETRPVLLLGESASQYEVLALQVWLQQWPRLRAAFSFCTGALSPRMCNGAVLDLQVVPRSVSPSQYRKIAAGAVIVDPRAPAIEQEPGMDVLVADVGNGMNGHFRQWLRACAGTESSRSLVGRLARVFRFWEAETLGEPAQLLQGIAEELQAAPLGQVTVSRLLFELFGLYRNRSGARGEIALLEALAVTGAGDVFSQATAQIEVRTRELFTNNTAACLDLLRRLLSCSLSSVGERIVRILLGSVSVADALDLCASKPHLLTTMVHANPALACSPDLWSRAPTDRREVLAALSTGETMTPEVMRGVVDAVIKARAEGIAEDLFRAAGELAVDAVLGAVRAGAMDLDWQWRNALSRRPDAVVTWVQRRDPLFTRDLALVAKLVSPSEAAVRARCTTIWTSYLQRSGDQDTDAVVAAFGLSLGLGQAEHSNLVLGFFQPVFDALEANNLDYTPWNWIREYAPALSWWRDWDKCERVAAAVAKRVVDAGVSPPEFFRAVRSETAFRHVVGALDARREGRSYLESLRRAADDPGLGTLVQRRVLQEDR